MFDNKIFKGYEYSQHLLNEADKVSLNYNIKSIDCT